MDLAVSNVSAKEHHRTNIQVPKLGEFLFKRPRLGLPGKYICAC